MKFTRRGILATITALFSAKPVVAQKAPRIEIGFPSLMPLNSSDDAQWMPVADLDALPNIGDTIHAKRLLP
jgi:hypothetical protein